MKNFIKNNGGLLVLLGAVLLTVLLHYSGADLS